MGNIKCLRNIFTSHNAIRFPSASCLKDERIVGNCEGRFFILIHSCFQSSTIPTYQKINAFMEGAKPNVYADSNKDGRLFLIGPDLSFIEILIGC